MKPAAEDKSHLAKAVTREIARMLLPLAIVFAIAVGVVVWLLVR